MGNLHLVTGFAGRAHITADDHASLNAAIIGGGQYVMNRGNNLSASVISNNQIRVYDGDIVMQGRHIRLPVNTYVDLTIENGSQGLMRNDLIVARYTKNSGTGVEDCNLVVIKGTAVASNPSDPEYTNGDIFADQAIQNDMPLYRVPLNGLTIGDLVPLFTAIDTTLATSQKSIKTTATIGTAWTGSSAPYTQTISIAGVKSTSPVEIMLPSSATADQVKAYQALNLQDGGQAEGSITLRAFGTLNTVEIPINVIIRGDL